MNIWSMYSYRDHTLLHFAISTVDSFNIELMNHPDRCATTFVSVMVEYEIIWVLL